MQGLRTRHLPRRRGAALMLMLLMLVVIIGMVAFSVDVGMMVLSRAEIQNAVDAGALAATLKLMESPGDIEGAEALAREFVRHNRVGTLTLVSEEAIQVERGRFDQDTSTFTATDFEPNAVRVFAAQEGEPFFFARIFGQDNYTAPATAIASGGKSLDIMMVLDLTGSMKRQKRIEALQTAAPVFVDVIESFHADDRIGMMGLSANPDVYDPAEWGHTGVVYQSGLHPSPSDHMVGVLEAPLTDDFNYLRDQVLTSQALTDGKYAVHEERRRAHTGTGGALGDAVHYLVYGPDSREKTEKVIVLMSDGEANRPRDDASGYALSMAAYAAENEVTVYTISLGSDADVDLMRSIAVAADGEHFDATGQGGGSLVEQLEKAFRHAAGTIKRAQLVQ